MPIRQVSYNWGSFARHAFKAQVDIDPAEMRKPFLTPDLSIHCDAAGFLRELGTALDEAGHRPGRHAEWLAWCRERVARYPVVQAKHRSTANGVNPYYFVDELWNHLADDDVVVCGDATACIVTFQASRVRGTQRVFSNSGSASMGYDLPAALGAAAARGGGRVVCLAGDGSLQMNIQELQTLAHHGWPVKLFVLNNGGYLSIRSTQSNFFGRAVGSGPESGVTFPDAVAVARAYGLPAERVEGPGFGRQVADLLALPGPAVGEVVLDRDQPFEPKLSSKQLPDGRLVTAPLEDMFPFLDADELRSNLLVPPAE
jgi:acetolactate synthase-1/2/3 large subunit